MTNKTTPTTPAQREATAAKIAAEVQARQSAQPFAPTHMARAPFYAYRESDDSRGSLPAGTPLMLVTRREGDAPGTPDAPVSRYVTADGHGAQLWRDEVRAYTLADARAAHYAKLDAVVAELTAWFETDPIGKNYETGGGVANAFWIVDQTLVGVILGHDVQGCEISTSAIPAQTALTHYSPASAVAAATDDEWADDQLRVQRSLRSTHPAFKDGSKTPRQLLNIARGGLMIGEYPARSVFWSNALQLATEIVETGTANAANRAAQSEGAAN